MPSNDIGEDGFDVIPAILNGSPFKIRPADEKFEILQKGRPLPRLNIVKRDSSRNCNRTFQSSWYEIHKWLCGSLSYNKLFCWPCTLMRPETSTWCSTGNDDMKRFTSLATKHATCKSHLKAVSEYNETLGNFGLPPEFVNEVGVKCKEEESASEDTDREDQQIVSLFSRGEPKDRKKDTNTPELQSQSRSSDSSKKESALDIPKMKTKITFKNWQEMNKDLVLHSKTKLFEDSHLYKWKRKVMKQELKNARLLGEKLKYEIEVLKAKVEYYKGLKDESSAVKNDSDSSQPSSLLINIQRTA